MSGVGNARDVADVLVSEEIREIRRERWSGVLVLTKGEIRKGIYFLEGDVAFAASTVEADRLGANLVRVGRITEAQFQAALAAAQAGQRLGQALIAAGVLSPAELAAAVTGQVERIVYSVLCWTSGRLQRRAMDRPLPADLVLDLSTPRLLLVGARVFPGPERLESALGAPSLRLRRSPHVPIDYESLPASPVEDAVLAACAPERTLEEVLQLPHPRPDLIRATYALVVGGLVESRASTEPEEMTPSPPSSLEAGERRAQTLLEKGQREAAVQILRALLEEHPQAVGCRRLLAMTLAQDGGFAPGVERLFLSVLEADPRDVELRYRLATYYRRAGMRARAVLQLRLVLSSDPSHAGAWRDLGELEASEGSQGR